MKLITEVSESIQLTEGKEKDLYIEGIFAQGNQKNRNGRVYPTDMLKEKIDDYVKNYVEKNRAFGELGHPSGPTVNGDRICMMIKEFRQEGDDFYGKAKITSTPMGEIVKGILKDGGQLGVSTRGMGTLKQKNGINEVQKDFMLAAVDVVTDPSAPNAFVNGIMEGVEWVYHENKGWIAEQSAEEIEQAVRSRELTEQKKLEIFKKYLSSL